MHGNEMWGVLLVPSSSPTLSPNYDGLDENVTSNITWFHLNRETVSRRIYTFFFYGGHSSTLRIELGTDSYTHHRITSVLKPRRRNTYAACKR